MFFDVVKTVMILYFDDIHQTNTNKIYLSLEIQTFFQSFKILAEQKCLGMFMTWINPISQKGSH